MRRAARARLWALADQVFPAFPYRERAGPAGREIPILRLEPVSGLDLPALR